MSNIVENKVRGIFVSSASYLYLMTSLKHTLKPKPLKFAYMTKSKIMRPLCELNKGVSVIVGKGNCLAIKPDLIFKFC